jgi:hypothetical protein
MTVSIHQPQYIPWLPYFSKIKQSDVFVLLDDVQFQKNGLQNRNYVWSKNGELRLTIPVRVNLGDHINKVAIADKKVLKNHWQSIEMSYKRAPYFEEVSAWMKGIYTNDVELLNDIATNFIYETLKYLNINTQVLLSSNLEKEGVKSDLVLSICKTLGAQRYLTGSGALDYLIQDDFKNAGIAVVFMEYKQRPYNQINTDVFIENLSIVDLLFNNGLKSIDYL